MEENKESIITGYPNVIPYECTKKLVEQMEKGICKIIIGNKQGTGFLCKIPFPNKNKILPVFITNNHIINRDLLNNSDAKIIIDIKEEADLKEIYLNHRIKYTNKEYDITIIEIKEKDNIKNYLELDDIIINDILYNINKNKEYINETIYLIQYPENKLSVSFGILNYIYDDKKYNFNHKCSTKWGSSGSPILNIDNKIIGIHKEGNMNSKNYNRGLFLNYPIKDFINEILLKMFNKKYNLDIQNTKIDNFNLVNFKLKNEGLIYFSKIEFKGLKTLCMRYNNISDIKVLEKVHFENLEILKLGENEISDINVFEKVNFKELKELYLYTNYISDIKVLGKVKMEKLNTLVLGENQISDISILEKMNCKEMKELYLYSNYISDIKVLGKVKFEKLEVLSLVENNISDIEVFKRVNFKELKELYLYSNNISDIKVLENVKFEKLELLSFHRNKINDIDILEKVNFKDLKKLYFCYNNISNIKIFEKVEFKKLEILHLNNNLINKEENDLIISKLKSKLKTLII